MKKLLLLALLLSVPAWASYSPNTIITDPAGVNQASVKAASTAAIATDKALVVALSPNNTAACTESGTWTVQPGNTANTTAWKVDGSAVTQPISIAAGLPVGSNVIGKVSIDQTTPGTTNLVALAANQSVNVAQMNGVTTTMGNGVAGTGVQRVAIASDNTPFTVQTKAPLSATGSGSAAAATVSTVITLTAPANAVGFILQNWDTSTANIIWAVGRTATTTLGQQLQPGRDTGFVPLGANVSLVAASGTQTYDIQWVAQ